MPVTLPPMHRDITSDAAERAWQHWVPEAYLRQWRDPATPQGAYVWVCPKDGSAPPRRQSPKKTFTSKDMNTMTRDGLRNLRLESVYHAMETGFGAVRAKIVAGEQATDADLGGVVHFVAAQMVRTPKFRDSWRFAAEDHAAQLAEIADLAARATGRVLADVAANQSQILCLAAFPRVLELLGDMRVLLLEAAVPRAFLTSDSPCCVIDRKDAGRTLFDALEAPTSNVLMPLSPDVAALFDHSDGPHEMVQILRGHPCVEGINEMIRAGASKEVVLLDGTLRERWPGGVGSEGTGIYSVL